MSEAFHKIENRHSFPQDQAIRQKVKASEIKLTLFRARSTQIVSNLPVIPRLEFISRMGNEFRIAATSSHYAIEMKLAVPLRIIFLPVRNYPSRVVFPAGRPYGATAFGIGSEAAVKPLL